jgi:hypothetical protein
MKKLTDTSSIVLERDRESNRAEGSQILARADKEMCAAAGINRNVVSFSLFGQEPGYCECAVLNAVEMPRIYPGWEMWVFHDESVPESILDRLKRLGVTTAKAKDWRIEHWPGTFWRFAAALVPNANAVIFRDADSVVSLREQKLVSQWLESSKPFHVIRDWYSHTDLILAGLWGAYAPFICNIDRWVESYIKDRNLHPTHADQQFLAQYVWPRIRNYTLIHDSVHDGENIVSFEPASSTKSDGRDSLGGYRMKKFEITSKSPYDGDYLLSLVNESGKTVCAYTRKFAGSKDTFSLPTEYVEHIIGGDWKLLVRKSQFQGPLGPGDSVVKIEKIALEPPQLLQNKKIDR